MSTLQITIDLDRSGVDRNAVGEFVAGDGLTRDEAITIVRHALFFTPLSFKIEDAPEEGA